jgi:hypothetical protein
MTLTELDYQSTIQAPVENTTQKLWAGRKWTLEDDVKMVRHTWGAALKNRVGSTITQADETILTFLRCLEG